MNKLNLNFSSNDFDALNFVHSALLAYSNELTAKYIAAETPKERARAEWDRQVCYLYQWKVLHAMDLNLEKRIKGREAESKASKQKVAECKRDAEVARKAYFELI